MPANESFPPWTGLPFVVLVVGIATLPMLVPKLWEKLAFQAAVALVCAAPVATFLLSESHQNHLWRACSSYLSFMTTIGALYVTTSGIFVSGDIEATPRTNAVLMLGSALLASAIGTTGASVLMIRPFLRTNRQRRHTAHLVPFFILLVANVGGLLTPLGDPPLLLGYVEGVPFFWTLRLFPYWLLYVGTIGSAFYVTDRRAYRRETPDATARDRAEIVPLRIHGKRSVALLLAVVGAVFLPSPLREGTMVGIASLSYFFTARDVHEKNAFSLLPILELAVLFLGLFVCLAPVEVALAASAPTLPFSHAWQLFWVSGILSSVLDNAPTYAAFAALARGLGQGAPDLVAGISPIHLTAISLGSVLMGATTYLGNGPNLVVKALAERAGYPTPSFARYAVFALAILLPIHAVTTVALILLER